MKAGLSLGPEPFLILLRGESGSPQLSSNFHWDDTFQVLLLQYPCGKILKQNLLDLHPLLFALLYCRSSLLASLSQQ